MFTDLRLRLYKKLRVFCNKRIAELDYQLCVNDESVTGRVMIAVVAQCQDMYLDYNLRGQLEYLRNATINSSDYVARLVHDDLILDDSIATDVKQVFFDMSDDDFVEIFGKMICENIMAYRNGDTTEG